MVDSHRSRCFTHHRHTLYTLSISWTLAGRCSNIHRSIYGDSPPHHIRKQIRPLTGNKGKPVKDLPHRSYLLLILDPIPSPDQDIFLCQMHIPFCISRPHDDRSRQRDRSDASQIHIHDDNALPDRRQVTCDPPGQARCPQR